MSTNIIVNGMIYTLPLVTNMAVTGASLTVRPRLQLLSVGWATKRRPSNTNFASSWAHSNTSTAIYYLIVVLIYI